MFPTEIYHYIVSKMDGFERENMRLVCKMFNEFGFVISSKNPARDREVLLIDCNRRYYELFQYGHLDIIEQCYKRYGNRRNTFELSCRYGFTDFAKYVYYEGDKLLSSICKSSLGAVEGGHIDTIEMLMGLGYIDIMRCMRRACESGNIDMFEYLLQYLQSPPTSDSFICEACESGNIDMVNRVMELSPTRKIELYSACLGGNMDIVYLMIGMGANDWNWGFDGACQGGHFEIAKLMIELGATHTTYIVPTCESGNINILRMQIKLGANDFGCGFYGAVVYNQIKIVRFLMGYGVDVKNSLDVINNNSSIELIKLLIENGAEVNEDSLLSAMRMEDLDMVKLLLEYGVKVPDFTENNYDKRIVAYLRSLK